MLTGQESAVWIKVFAALIIIVMTGVNIVGSKLVANAQSVIVVVVVGILTVFAVVLLVNIHASLLAPSGYPSWKDIISSVALTFFAFLGFGIITFTAKDLREPSRQLPRAMFIALGIATVIYVAIALGVFGSAGVVLVTFVFTTLIHEPASIATLLGIIVLGVVLDFWWKRVRADRAKQAPVTS